MKVQLDLIKIVVGFSGDEVYWPKYVEKVMDDEGNLVPASSFTLDDLFSNYLFEYDCLVESGGEPSMGMEVTLEVVHADHIPAVVQDFAAYLDEWNVDMKEKEAAVMEWHAALTEDSDPLGMSDMDIMI